MEKTRALMTMHILSQIELEHKTAVCSVCGPTEIHIPDNYERSGSRIVCVQRYDELNRYKKMWYALSPEERKLARKEKHRLTDVDPALNRAVCAICGPTDLYPYTTQGRTVYRCATFYRLIGRSETLQRFVEMPAERDLLSEIYQKKKEVKGSLFWSDLKQINLGDLTRFDKPKPRVHYLQEASDRKKKRIEENTRLVHEYKRTHGCKRCGIRGLEPGKMRFFDLPFPPDQKIRRLVTKLDLEDLAMELGKHDLYCQNCYPSIQKEYNKRTQSLRSAQILRSSLKSS